MAPHVSRPAGTRDLEITLGHDELIISRRYEILSILNDIAIALFFIVGSVLFFYPDLSTAGTWCFLIGSIELLVRPLIRLTRRVHLERVGNRTGGHPQDF
jgi:hypothetical protein